MVYIQTSLNRNKIQNYFKQFEMLGLYVNREKLKRNFLQ